MDEYLAKGQKFDEEAKKNEFTMASDGVVRFKGRIYLLKMVDLKSSYLKKLMRPLTLYI